MKKEGATNGRWSRGYAFADGQVEIASSSTMDFTDWEQRKRRTRTQFPVRDLSS